MRAILLGGGLALVLSLLGTRVAIRVLSAKGYGQEIRDDGPTSHHTKRGTPTMGGIVIIAAAVLGYLFAKLVTWTPPSASAWLLLFLFVGLGMVGFLDDFIKIYKQRSLGLRSKAKMIGQTVIALTFGALALSPWLESAANGRTPASNHVSFLRDIAWLGLPAVVAVLLIWFIIAGTSNGMNLTDGLDGLAAGASTMVFGAYTLVCIWQFNQLCGPGQVNEYCYEVRDPLDLGIVAAAITGAYVALADAIQGLLDAKAILRNPLHGAVAAVSVGIFRGMPVLDLDYAEDSDCDTDMNIVMNDGGGFIEVQGTAEGHAFRRDELNTLLSLGEQGCRELLAAQQAALAG